MYITDNVVIIIMPLGIDKSRVFRIKQCSSFEQMSFQRVPHAEQMREMFTLLEHLISIEELMSLNIVTCNLLVLCEIIITINMSSIIQRGYKMANVWPDTAIKLKQINVHVSSLLFQATCMRLRCLEVTRHGIRQPLGDQIIIKGLVCEMYVALT